MTLKGVLYQVHIAMDQKTLRKLLVIDDEKDIRDFLREFFEARDYTVQTAGSLAEAQKAFEEEKPHVALIDIKMRTDRDGLEFLKWMKERSPEVKAIMVSALERIEVTKEAQSLGADDFITKPLSLEYLETTVTNKIQEFFAKDPNPQH